MVNFHQRLLSILVFLCEKAGFTIPLSICEDVPEYKYKSVLSVLFTDTGYKVSGENLMIELTSNQEVEFELVFKGRRGEDVEVENIEWDLDSPIEGVSLKATEDGKKAFVKTGDLALSQTEIAVVTARADADLDKGEERELTAAATIFLKRPEAFTMELKNGPVTDAETAIGVGETGIPATEETGTEETGATGETPKTEEQPATGGETGSENTDDPVLTEGNGEQPANEINESGDSAAESDADSTATEEKKEEV